PIGEVWHCSNWSFAVRGRLVEIATGKTYEAAVRELLFIPLGMSRSCFNADEAITHRVAIGHVIVDEQPRVARPWAFPRATTPVGGVVSSVRELLAYARFHLGDGRTRSEEHTSELQSRVGRVCRLLLETQHDK